MKKNFKVLSLIAIGSALCLGVTALSIASPSIFKPLEYVQRNAASNFSVTFNNIINVDNKGECTSSLANGGTIKAYGTARATNGEFSLSSSNYVFFKYLSNGVNNDSITIGDESREFAPFQDLKTITARTSGSVKVYYSSDGSSWLNKTLNDGLSTSISGAKYLYITATTSSSGVSNIVINYSCNAGGDEPEPAIGLSGVYKSSTYVTVTFNNDGSSGEYLYNDGNKFNFTYSIADDEKITFYRTSEGDPDSAFGNYQLFKNSTTNSTGKITSDTEFTVKCYNPFGGSSTKTFTKQ